MVAPRKKASIPKAKVTPKAQVTSKSTLKLIIEFALDKKAEELVVLDMRKIANFCDYFVVCTAGSERQSRAIAQSIAAGLKDHGMHVRYKEGIKDSNWVLLDLGDIVIHIFEKEARDFYGLEYLWQDAVKVNVAKL